MIKWEDGYMGARHMLQKTHDVALTEAFPKDNVPLLAIQWKAQKLIGQFPMELINVHIPMFDKCRELV
jgi:hypothetical protein